MKSLCLLAVLALAVAVSAQRRFNPFNQNPFLSRNPSVLNEGAYRPVADGTYKPDNSGAYNKDDGKYHPDNSGQYVHSDDKYKHQGDKFGNGGSNNGGSGGFGQGGNNNNNNGLTGGFVTLFPAGGASSEGDAFARPPKVEVVHRPVRPVHTGSQFVADGFGQSQNVVVGSAAGKYDNRNYKIIRKIQNVEQDGYHYLYETENGITGEEQGKVANVGTDEEVMKAHGFYTYTGPDNVVYTVRYTADENGFVPEGAHIPTPPPIPAAILRSLEYQRSLGKL